MKTAEEWCKEVSFGDNAEPIIQQIQLNAMKEGMRRAANILQKEVSACHGPGPHDDCMPCVARNNSTIDITKASGQLTIKDLEV